MNDERNLPAPPPRGMILIDGEWRIRRYGLVVQRDLTCIYGHRFKVGDERPFEIAKPCGHMDDRGSQIRCSARLYMFVTRPRLLWAMDMTAAEALLVMTHSLDIEQIVEYFGANFPAEMKVPRAS